MDFNQGQYLGNLEREETVRQMEQLLSNYSQEIDKQPSDGFWNNVSNFWGALRSVVTGPFTRLEIRQQYLGRQGGRYINTMRELSGQEPYSQ